MKKESFSLCIILRNTMCTALVLLVLLSAPTGWLYDLWAGEGTEQGQWPSIEVQRLRQQESGTGVKERRNDYNWCIPCGYDSLCVF